MVRRMTHPSGRNWGCRQCSRNSCCHMTVKYIVRHLRRISIRQNEKQIGKLRGPNGYRLCRWCNKEVFPPRKTFCSDECVHQWRLRSSVKYLRQNVYMRDCGICAQCGIDTRQLRIRLEDKRRELLHANGSTWETNSSWAQFLRECKLTRKEAWKSLWQADHINPVAQGGGLCGIDGIQTLCLVCHKAKSKRAARKKPPHE